MFVTALRASLLTGVMALLGVDLAFAVGGDGAEGGRRRPQLTKREWYTDAQHVEAGLGWAKAHMRRVGPRHPEAIDKARRVATAALGALSAGTSGRKGTALELDPLVRVRLSRKAMAVIDAATLALKDGWARSTYAAADAVSSQYQYRSSASAEAHDIDHRQRLVAFATRDARGDYLYLGDAARLKPTATARIAGSESMVAQLARRGDELAGRARAKRDFLAARKTLKGARSTVAHLREHPPEYLYGGLPGEQTLRDLTEAIRQARRPGSGSAVVLADLLRVRTELVIERINAAVTVAEVKLATAATAARKNYGSREPLAKEALWALEHVEKAVRTGGTDDPELAGRAREARARARARRTELRAELNALSAMGR